MNIKKLKKLGLSVLDTSVEPKKKITVAFAPYLQANTGTLPPGATSHNQFFNPANGTYSEYAEVDGQPAYKKTISIPSLGWSAEQFINFNKIQNAWFLTVPTAPDLIIPTGGQAIIVDSEGLEPGSYFSSYSIVLKGENADSPELVKKWTATASSRNVLGGGNMIVSAVPENERTVFNNLKTPPIDRLRDIEGFTHQGASVLISKQGKLEWAPIIPSENLYVTNHPNDYRLEYAYIEGSYSKIGPDPFAGNNAVWYMNNSGCIISFNTSLNVWEIISRLNGTPGWNPASFPNGRNAGIVLYRTKPFATYQVPRFTGGNIEITANNLKPSSNDPNIEWEAVPTDLKNLLSSRNENILVSELYS